MSVFGTLYRGEQNVDFPKLWPKALAVSVALLVLSVGSLVFRGLNLGIEFEGGTSWEVVAPDQSIGDVRDTLAGTGASSAQIQTVGGDIVRVRSDLEAPDSVATVTTALAEMAGVDENSVSVTTVGPSWGGEITDKAVNALIWFFILVAVYIAVRLEWKMAVGALIAVAHDMLITVGLYSVFAFEVTPATVIAFLTIMGYSLYDTIVVFDKCQEIEGRLAGAGRHTYTQMMNISLNQVLMRSINTSITSLLPVLSMLIVGSVFLGALTLQEFAIALAIGLVLGAYSTLFVAASLVAYIKEREPNHQSVARRLAARSDDGVDGAEPAPVVAASAPTRPRPSSSQMVRPGGAPPRPRKKKKKR